MVPARAPDCRGPEDHSDSPQVTELCLFGKAMDFELFFNILLFVKWINIPLIFYAFFSPYWSKCSFES